ncbi:MAG TPA: FAD-dependent oxidoreductase [Syntrophales bacterium]|nr:FAD-dependent oxidoreductase [Syntrophales bacterium]HOX93502.1 FAD-dependent oxidoreductase [Syntrophales bacterium]HPI57528.1 FAD-dependent oxidoreductase [Syntrophales bacterium]HPN24685.1 FAD-dependent oxidoreductase [Syntrophales bacterium]HQM29816.1 FAD-dependent oxidoreductase [Syntrophales bacterium]
MHDRVKRALVIGGGPAGMEAAIQIGQAGFGVILVEREPEPGGTLKKLVSSFPKWENPADLVMVKRQMAEDNRNVECLTGTTVLSAERRQKGFRVTLRQSINGGSREVNVDAVILATGFDLMDVSIYGEYGYGIYPNVMSSLEFEDRIRGWKEGAGPPPKGVAFFKCVGSRDRSKGFPYCSRICCMYTAKQAGLVKDLFPGAKVYVFYMDYRAAGKRYEEFVRDVIEKKHVRYVRGRPAKVVPENGRLLVRAEDTLMGIPVEVAVDAVVLASAIVPRAETRALAKMFGALTDEYGFIESLPYVPARCGEKVFFAGGCGFAVETQGALQQGAAAAAEVIALLSKSEF